MGWHNSFHNAFASSLLSLLANKLTEVVSTEISHVWNVNENLGLLATKTQILQLKLSQLGDNELPKEWKKWVQEVINVFYDVDDIIDGIRLDWMNRNHNDQSTNVQDQECTSNILSTLYRSLSGRRVRENANHHHQVSQTEYKVRGLILKSLKKWGLPHKISVLLAKLERIEKQVDSLTQAADRNKPSSSTSAANTSHLGSIQVCIPSSSGHLQGPLAWPREEDKSLIIDMLRNPPDGRRGVCIVGMSGLGKTTLARYIQKNAAVRKHFGSVIWGSGHFDAEANLNFETTIQAGHSANGYPVNILDHGGKFLVVLDDLWNVHHTSWSRFTSSHLCKDATFLITTRDPNVASITSTIPYHIKRLSDEDCERLIINMLPKELVYQYGPSISCIARKCAGLPLVANLFSLVIKADCYRKDREAAISNLEQSDIWKLKVFRDEIFPALRFDDPALPPELSKFLAYLPLFPYDYNFKKDELSQLWMAEGFITPEEWSASGLKNAGTYFDHLLSRSFLHSSNNSREHKMTAYKIHEFTYRFAQSLAFNLCYQLNDTDPSFLPTTCPRHLSLCSQNIDPNYLEVIQKFYSRLRTFLLLPKQRANISEVPESLFHKLHLLRVVSLRQSYITSLPRSISNLKHLRYLDASYTPIQSLPDSICDLLGLRIIILKNCPNLLHLPNRIRNLVGLFYLDIDLANLPSIPPFIGALTNLQNLDVFKVKNRDGYRITELRNMKSLRGCIKIKELENVQNPSEAKTANLCQKEHLQKLELHWTCKSMQDSSAADILNELRPSDNLKELWLTNYNGDTFPSWFCSPSCNLKVIHLYNCPYIDDDKLPAFWKLPELRSLQIDTAQCLEHLGRQFLGDLKSPRFPKLENLQLRNMESLARFEDLEAGDMPRLCDLRFVACPALYVVPTLRLLTSLKTVEIICCPSLKEDPDFPLSVESYIFR